MDWDRVEGSWKEFRGRVKSKWGELSDDDLTQISGKRDELLGKLQARYGYTKDRARQEIDRWLDSIDTDGVMQRATDARERAMHVVDNFSGALQKSLKENPGATLAITAVLAFVIGALWKS